VLIDQVGPWPLFKICKPVKVYRDNDKDEILDMTPDTIQAGLFGINIHRASVDHRPNRVGRWSAGCQGLADPRNFAGLWTSAG